MSTKKKPLCKGGKKPCKDGCPCAKYADAIRKGMAPKDISAANELRALFGPDKGITVGNLDKGAVTLYVKDPAKYMALSMLLDVQRLRKERGLVVDIAVPKKQDTATMRCAIADLGSAVDKALSGTDEAKRAIMRKLYGDLFAGHPSFHGLVEKKLGEKGLPVLYVVFRPDIVSFWCGFGCHYDGMVVGTAPAFAEDLLVECVGVYFNSRTGRDR